MVGIHHNDLKYLRFYVKEGKIIETLTLLKMLLIVKYYWYPVRKYKIETLVLRKVSTTIKSEILLYNNNDKKGLRTGVH